MAENSVAESAGSAERILVIERIFNAPRALVFKAWTEPEHMVRWFGPRGFTSTIITSDVRRDGAYRVRMRGPDGDHWLQGVYSEVVEPQSLVFTYAWTDSAGIPTRPETLVRVTFEEHGGKTRLTLHQAIFESLTARDAHQEGWSSSFERLAEYLATVQ